MSFKPKTTKTIKTDEIMTLDSEHEKYIYKFNKYDNIIIPKLKKEKNKLIQILKSEKMTYLKRIEIEGKIKKLNKDIKVLLEEKKQYYLENSKYIFNYYEGKKNISSDNKKPKILEEFFNINTVKNKKEMENKTKDNTHSYFTNVNDDYLDIKNFIYNKDICSFCNKGELIPIDYEGVLVCDNCYKHTPYLFDYDKPSYKEPPKEVCFYAYKRINHFREILAQFQAKETTQIPKQLIVDMKNQIVKERLSLSELTNEKSKSILKKLGYNKCIYVHV